MSAPATIRVMLVDDKPLPRFGLKFFLLTFADLEVVAEATNGGQALELCLQFHPDVLILDMAVSNIDGPTTAKTLHDLCPSTKILILTSLPEGTLAQQTLQAGAVGCLFKYSPSEELVTAIRAAHADHSI
jgi:two-component system, NarL family, response regulator LiaR